MDKIDMSFLPMVNAHAKEMRELKITREIERQEKAKAFVINVGNGILAILGFYLICVGLFL